MHQIHIAAAALCRADGATLLVRKRGTDLFMQPGGKIDAGETALVALCRELHEELALAIDPAEAEPLGQLTAPAAHEPGHEVVAQIFRVTTEATLAPQAEIAEARWIWPADLPGLPLAPLTRDLVLPLIWPGLRG